MGYDAEKFKARANTKAGNIWLILNILLTMQYLSNMTKGTYDRKFIIPFLIIGWVPYIIGVIYTKIKGKSADGQNDIAPVVNSEDTAKQDNVKESDAKNADDNINQTVDNQESLSEVLAKKITTESDGKAKNNMSESNEANNKVTYADVADNMISNITDTFADIITEDISTVKEADIVNQVIDSVKLMASRELTSMEVMLNPEHLGSVHITVTARNGIVSAQIAAQNEQVKTALENQMVTLMEQFESQGLKVDAVEITVMAHSFEAGQNFGQSESERKQGESKVHRKLDLSSFDDELEEDLESTAPAPKAEGSSVEYLA